MLWKRNTIQYIRNTHELIDILNKNEFITIHRGKNEFHIQFAKIERVTPYLLEVKVDPESYGRFYREFDFVKYGKNFYLDNNGKIHLVECP